MRKHYAPALKAKVVLEMLQETRSVTERAAAYQIAPRLLHRWRREVVDRLPDLFADPAVAARQARATTPRSSNRTRRLARGPPRWPGSTKSGLDPDA